MSNKTSNFEWGKVQGAITLPAHLREAAHSAGTQAYLLAEEEEFAGDPVTWLPEDPWHAACAELFPADAVRALGFELATKVDAQFRVYTTHGTDPHIDGEGPCFILVLANNGLKFKQGKQSHTTAAGEWFIFDDRITHSVKETSRSTSYVFLHHALKAIA